MSPCGLSAGETWQNIAAGRSGVRRITSFDIDDFPSQIAGDVPGFEAEKWIERRRLKEGDRFIHMAIAASVMAMEDAGLKPSTTPSSSGEVTLTEEELTRTGTLIGVGMCGLGYIERMAAVLTTKGPRRISPFFIPATITNLAPGQVAMRFGLKGPSYTTTSACCSGAHAIGEAFRWIQRGDIDTAVAGGAEAAITGLGVGGFTAMRALSTRNDAPEEASRPFDKDRDGFVIAEGAGIIILEEYEKARRRGANILAEVVGYGASTDAYHLTQPAPHGEGAQRAMSEALRDAQVAPDEVDYINAHATSTGLGDIAEVEAISAVFGEHAASKKLWVSSTKSMTGHLLGAAGGLEACLAVQALGEDVVPPTINLDNVDPSCSGLELVPHEARERKLRCVASNSFGFGGANTCLIFKKT